MATRSLINSASLIFIFLAIVSSSVQTQAAQRHNDFRKCLSLHSANSKVIYTPNNLRLNPSTYTRKPQVIVTPVDESQIQAVILCAKKSGMQIQTRSGGHDFEALSYTSKKSRDPFIILDLVNLSEITVDADSKTAWVQAGATVEQLNYRIAEKSKTLEFPSGIGSTIGVGGHFSGSDHIVDARIVDVEGRILDRESMGEDLFWSVRGAATASFGVITAYKVNLVTVPEIISTASVAKTLEQNATELNFKWQSPEGNVEVLDQTFPEFGAASADDHENFLKCLFQQFQDQTSISNDVYTPINSSYDSILRSSIRNLRFASESTPKPRVIITPENKDQIPPVIKCAKKHDMQIRIRSGGHDYEGLSYVSKVPFVILDLFNFNKTTVDAEQKTAWVESGSNLGNLYYTIAKKSQNLAFPGGVCPSVGVGGLISGGGYGMMLRKHGVAADNVIAAKIIDVKGRILEINSMEHKDLFWAIRGGGGASFGVILAWKLQLVDVRGPVTVFRISKTLEQGATPLVKRWQDIAHTFDKDLLLRIILKRVNPSEDNGRKLTINVTFNSFFLGGVDRLIPYMQENFPELGLVKEDCTEMTWIQSVLYFAGLDIKSSLDVLLQDETKPSYFKAKSDFVEKSIPESGLDGLWDLFYDEEGKDAEVILGPYGGVMSEISESAIPFPHRAGYLYKIQYLVYWDEKEEENSNRYISWIKKLHCYMTPYVSSSPRAAYINYRDLDIGVNNDKGPTSYAQASIWGFPYFKEKNFKELARVKTIYDPENFFRNEQSIPPFHSMWTKYED